jgi:hypothetical protein
LSSGFQRSRALPGCVDTPSTNRSPEAGVKGWPVDAEW